MTYAILRCCGCERSVELPLPPFSLGLGLTREGGADVAIWQEAISVCQEHHKYKQGREEAFMASLPARGWGCVMTSSCLR